MRPARGGALALLLLLLAGCTSDPSALDPVDSPGPGATPSGAERSAPAQLVGEDLVLGERRLALPADLGATGVAGQVDVDGDGSPEVVLRLRPGASTDVYALVATDAAGQLALVAAPPGEPGAGDPWRLTVGASAAGAAGLRCTATALVRSTSEPGEGDAVTVTTTSYALRGAVATALAPAAGATVGTGSAAARAVGQLDCPGLG